MILFDNQNTITRQIVRFNITGTKLIDFSVMPVVEESDWSVMVHADHEDCNQSQVVICKDPMFVTSHEQFALNGMSVISAKDSPYFVAERYVAGDATGAQAQADFFTAVNGLLAAYPYKKSVQGRYLSSTGQLCIKGDCGREQFIDLVVIKSDNGAIRSGYEQKYPERSNNAPVPHTLRPASEESSKRLTPTAPKMSVNDWLNSDLYELADEAGKKRILANKAAKALEDEDRREWVSKKAAERKSNRQRLALWQASQQQKAEDDARYGCQLSLI